MSQLGGADDLATGRENLILQGRLYGGRPADGAQPGASAWRRARPRRVRRPDASCPTRAVSAGVSTSRSASCTSPTCSSSTSRRPASTRRTAPTSGTTSAPLRERGTTVFLTTHYLEEADALADRVMIMDHGRIVAEGTPQDLKRRVAGDTIVVVVKDERPPTERADLLAEQTLRPGGSAHDEHIRLYVDDGSVACRRCSGCSTVRHVGLRTMSCRSRRSTTCSSARPAGRCATRQRERTATTAGTATRRCEGGRGMKTATDTRLLFNRSRRCCATRCGCSWASPPPILYLVLFTPLLGHFSGVEGQHRAVPRRLPARHPLAARRSPSGSASGFSTIFELQPGVIERFRVTPASRFAILMGPILSGLVDVRVQRRGGRGRHRVRASTSMRRPARCSRSCSACS